MGWKYNDEKLKKIYLESKYDLKMSYKEFKKMAEEFANQLIEKAKKETKNVKQTIKE